MRSRGLAIFSALGLLGWCALVCVKVLGATLGDGVTGMPMPQGAILLIPIAYFGALFLCSFRLVNGVALALT